MTTYLSAVPLAFVRLESGGYANVLEGDHVPADILQEDLDRLVDRGWLVEALPAEDAAAEPGTKDEILAYVGDDKAKAQEYLDAENAAAKPRVTLVAALEAIVAAE